MQSNMLNCFQLVEASEGGNVDNPKDPGGRTGTGGITQTTFDAWNDTTHQPRRDVFTITREEQRAIYKAQYWAPICGDVLPDGLDYLAFNAAIMSGPSRAILWLQEALTDFGYYTGAIDAHFGLMTLQAVQAAINIAELCDRFEDYHMKWLEAHADWKDFSAGWTARENGALKAAIAMTGAENYTPISQLPSIPIPPKPVIPVKPKKAPTMFNFNLSTWFSGEVMSSIERKGLSILGTYLVTHGIASADQWSTLAGGITVAVSIITGIVQAKLAATNSQTVSAVGLVPNVPAAKQPAQPTALPTEIAK